MLRSFGRNTDVDIARQVDHWQSRATQAERQVSELIEQREVDEHENWIGEQIAHNAQRRADSDALTNQILATLRGEA